MLCAPPAFLWLLLLLHLAHLPLSLLIIACLSLRTKSAFIVTVGMLTSGHRHWKWSSKCKCLHVVWWPRSMPNNFSQPGLLQVNSLSSTQMIIVLGVWAACVNLTNWLTSNRYLPFSTSSRAFLLSGCLENWQIAMPLGVHACRSTLISSIHQGHLVSTEGEEGVVVVCQATLWRISLKL